MKPETVTGNSIC